MKGKALDLTATEFKLLTVLAQRRGRVQSREQLFRTSGNTTTSSTPAPWIRTCAGCAKNWDRRRNISIRCAELVTGFWRNEQEFRERAAELPAVDIVLQFRGPRFPRMPYLLIAIVLVAAVALHLWWRRRYARLHEQWLKGQQSLPRCSASNAIRTPPSSRRSNRPYSTAWPKACWCWTRPSCNWSTNRYRNSSASKRMCAPRRPGKPASGSWRSWSGGCPTRTEVVQGIELMPGVNGRRLEINAAAVLDRAGTHHGSIVVFHDLTRLKQLENTVRNLWPTSATNCAHRFH